MTKRSSISRIWAEMRTSTAISAGECRLALQRLDLLADEAGLLLAVPGAGDRHLLARLVLGAQRLAEPALVVGDEMRGGGEDVAGRAVVALQPHHGRAGKIVLEAQDVVDLGAAPAIDRLVVVADAGDVCGALREQPQPEILRDVGVLVFVDEDVAEALLICAQHVRVLAEERAGISSSRSPKSAALSVFSRAW